MSHKVDHVFKLRSSGILLHPTSLPGPNGCGDLGASAYHFVDWLVKAGQNLWQVLPLNPIGPGNSPYQSVSAFAGCPLLINLEDLVSKGWLSWEPYAAYELHRCDYERASKFRMARLQAAWLGFKEVATAKQQMELKEFCTEQAEWLSDYALFMALDGLYGSPWNEWPAEFASRQKQAMDRLPQDISNEVGFWSFVQWQFMCQWRKLRQYANDANIRIIGDAPIFLAHHSADVWANPTQYMLDEFYNTKVVAGVPPDYFSPTGQRWGNPIYDWTAMQEDGFTWWQHRIKHQLNYFDVLRLDHFRGFEAHWEIPAANPNAIVGEWRIGPGHKLFNALLDELNQLPFIAEDLGFITNEVNQLRLSYGFPGMRVLQFAFGDSSQNPYLPHNYVANTIAYTGTHDNNTCVGWWNNLSSGEREMVTRYLGPQADLAIHWAMIRSISQSVAVAVIYPFQDVLGLGESHRMNVPGKSQDCWEWRFEWIQVEDSFASQLAIISESHGRVHHHGK